jgi:hypothetical protein
MRLLTLLLVSAAVAAACPGQTGPDAKSSALPFTITISGPAEVKAGSEVDVRVKITNTSTREVNAGAFYVDGVDTGYTYDVRDSAGNPAQKKNIVMSGSVKFVRLKPGESAEERTLVNRVFDMTRPGQYEIQLSRTVGGPKDAVVKSNKITVTITP